MGKQRSQHSTTVFYAMFGKRAAISTIFLLYFRSSSEVGSKQEAALHLKMKDNF